jgi:hypothetical protein
MDGPIAIIPGRIRTSPPPRSNLPRQLLLLPTATYRTTAFVEAARRLGLDLTVASEQPSSFEQARPDALRYVELSPATPLTAGDPDRRIDLELSGRMMDPGSSGALLGRGLARTWASPPGLSETRQRNRTTRTPEMHAWRPR